MFPCKFKEWLTRVLGVNQSLRGHSYHTEMVIPVAFLGGSKDAKNSTALSMHSLYKLTFPPGPSKIILFLCFQKCHSAQGKMTLDGTTMGWYSYAWQLVIIQFTNWTFIEAALDLGYPTLFQKSAKATQSWMVQFRDSTWLLQKLQRVQTDIQTLMMQMLPGRHRLRAAQPEELLNSLVCFALPHPLPGVRNRPVLPFFGHWIRG